MSGRTRTLPLAAIAGDVAFLRRALAAGDDAGPDDLQGLDPDDAAEMLAEWEAELLPGKVDAYAAFIREQEAEAERLKRWEADLAAARRAADNRRKAALERLLLAMEALGADRLEGEASRFVRQTRAKVEIVDEAALPAEHVVEKTTRRADKAAIAKVLKRGESVPGAVLGESAHVRRTL